MAEVVEAYRGYSPPCDLRSTVEELLGQIVIGQLSERMSERRHNRFITPRLSSRRLAATSAIDRETTVWVGLRSERSAAANLRARRAENPGASRIASGACDQPVKNYFEVERETYPLEDSVQDLATRWHEIGAKHGSLLAINQASRTRLDRPS
jgi:hypothetical protein